MNKRFDENVCVLQKKYPDIKEMIEEAIARNEENIEIESFNTLDGLRGIKVKKDNISYFMYGKREAARPVEKWFLSIGKLQNNAPVLIMGLANSLYIEKIVECSKNKLTIIVYEPSINIFIDFLSNVDISEWMEKHTIIFWVEGLFGMTKDRFENIVNSVLTYGILPLSRIYVLPNYYEIFPEESLFFIKTCHDIAKLEAVQFSTLKTFSGYFGKNMLLNVRWLCNQYKSTQLLKVVPKDVTGIVVAAGPSLNKNIKELKKAKGKSFIIAVDTAIKPLLKEGIVPDMFAIVDAQKPIKLIQCEGAENIPLSTVLDAPTDILEFHKGKKFFANEGIRFVDKIFYRFEKQYGTASSGGSVATAAFTLLYKLGLTKIILVGQDLAYTGKKSHADGTFEEVMKEEDTSDFIMVKGNIEELVPTTEDFKIYLEWYNNFIKKVKETDENFRVINATEGGAYIKGTEVMTLKDAIEQECTKEVDIAANFEKLNPMFEGEDRTWVIERIKSIPEEFRSIMADAKKAGEYYKKLEKICSKQKLDEKSYVNILKKISRTIKSIEENDLYQIIKLTMNEAEYILMNEQFIQYDSEKEEGKEMARQGIIFMNGIYECAKIYLEYVNSLDYEWEKFS